MQLNLRAKSARGSYLLEPRDEANTCLDLTDDGSGNGQTRAVRNCLSAVRICETLAAAADQQSS